jgi:hypothetical protein
MMCLSRCVIRGHRADHAVRNGNGSVEPLAAAATARTTWSRLAHGGEPAGSRRVHISLGRRRISNERRRRVGAELDENGLTDMHSPKSNALPLAAWEACDGDALLALVYALEMLGKQRPPRSCLIRLRRSRFSKAPANPTVPRDRG